MEDSDHAYLGQVPTQLDPVIWPGAYRAQCMCKPGTYVPYALGQWGWDLFVDWVCCRKEVFCYQGKVAEQEDNDGYPVN